MSRTSGSRLALRLAQGHLEQCRKVGVYDIVSIVDAGGPPSLRSTHTELRRGLAEAQQRPRP